MTSIVSANERKYGLAGVILLDGGLKITIGQGSAHGVLST